MSDLENFTPKLTADGSFTFVSQEFGESFHSHYGARQESFFKFVEPTQLARGAQKPLLRLLDVCYGLGYNTAAALETIWAVNPCCCVEVIGLELNPAVPQAAIAHQLFDNWNCNYQRDAATTRATNFLLGTYLPLAKKVAIGNIKQGIGTIFRYKAYNWKPL